MVGQAPGNGTRAWPRSPGSTCGCPVPLPAGDALEALQHAGLVTVEPALADTPSLILTLSQGEGRALRRLSLPEVLWV